VLYGIASHDDGWVARDAAPSITQQGKPSAFSTELVGKYSAFEEIDIADYLAVRDRAVRIIAERDPYAGMLVALHTYNLLTERADRSTIAPDGLLLLDAFLAAQRAYQSELKAAIAADAGLSIEEKSDQSILEHFRLLQACDNLSLLACVAYDRPAHLLHPLPLNDGGSEEVRVEPLGAREFGLSPWPFTEQELTFRFPARRLEGKLFASSAELTASFRATQVEEVNVRLRTTAA
jgi:hypothetical protein